MKFNPRKTILVVVGVILAVVLLQWIFAQFQIRRDVLWIGRSAEYRYATIQTYNEALEELQGKTSLLEGPWAVVMDVDDTCLSSIRYRLHLKRWRTLFYRPRWSNWIMRGTDPAVPGAAEFTHRVREMGGKIILITGRSEEAREPTERNLRREGIAYDALLMRGEGTSKDLWRRRVTEGEAVPGQGPLEIVMIIGDQMSDFEAEAGRTGEEEHWGDRYFLISNPMTGKWVRNY